MGSPFAALLVVLATLITLTVQVPVQVPSQVPSCSYVCPPADLARRPLEEHSESGSMLFCRYESNPNDFFCKYNLDDGELKQDHDEDQCPEAAEKDCPLPPRRRRNALPRSPAPPSPAARSPKPKVMKTRNTLGKKKRRV